MKLMTGLVLAAALIVTGCAKQDAARELGQWKAFPQTQLTADEIKAEEAQKIGMVSAFLKEQKLDGIVLTQVRNVYWITAGTANIQIVLNKDVGAASLLIMKDGSKYLLCNGAEAGRMMDESLGKLGYQLKKFNWYETNDKKDVRADVLKEIVKKGVIGSDAPFPGTVPVSDQFKKLRFSLTDTELKRYRWLGKECTEAVVEVCKAVQPGMDEFQIEAMTANALRARGIMPTVILIGVDDRIYKYRHALPGGAVLKNYAMVNIVAEKWGMPIAVTRFVHFGPVPADLEAKLLKTAKVNAHYEEATVPGKSCAQLFEECKTWYAEAGYPDEWMLHHQGGAIGYDDREYVIYPNVPQTVQDRQAFAWNPTITGAKIENTIIAFADRREVITKTDGWPMIKVELNGKVYEEPGILVR